MTAVVAASSVSQPLRDTLLRLVTAGLAGGGVDFVYASGVALSRGRPWTRPWDMVASGWIGRAAVEGGPMVTGLGILTHFGVATAMAAAYIHLARRTPAVVARPWATAPAYGLVLYAVMYLGVLPLRFGAPWRWNGVLSVLDIAAHVGVAVAIVAVVTRRRPQ
ncbi:hypothetical protein [Phenylobacterium sp.]|uniref:hypothetical protein n=1 Tax=Phenylobacterium sp. TaxID=1871053 RepID=UPI003D2BDBEE